MINFFDNLQDLYLQAGYVEVTDPHAMEIGVKHGENLVSLSLVDLGKMTGHVCPGVTSAFFIAKAAAKALYGTERVARENLKIAVPAYGDLSLVQSIIFDAFPAPEGVGVANKMFFDPSLNLGEGKQKFIFKRLDTGATCSITWDKKVAVPAEVGKNVKSYKSLKNKESVSDHEYAEWNSYINAQVERIITSDNENMLIVNHEENYSFPDEMKFNLI
ncbi:MAG: hypothetical protein A2X64_06285 [Ignavibacteria bacterium GWF2_33_9]|nr:MAG: hypothetical protein A2X64_06285 [Ignavibacteria bacterium GWF2_33_9]